MKRIVLGVLLFFVSGISFAIAQNDTGNGKKLMPRPPIYGIPAKTLPKGKAIYRSYFTWYNFSQMYNQESGEMTGLPENMSFRSLSYTPKFRYGLTNRITLIANFPLYYNVMNKNGFVKKGIGPGDVQAALLYKFYHNKQKRFLISGLLYTKWPTGKASGLQENQLALGTGSYDAGLALMPEKEIGRFDMRLSAFYVFRSKNSADVALGDVQMLSFSTAYNFSTKFIAEGTILYKSALNNRKEGEIIPDTYARLSQLIVGGQYRIAPAFLIQAAVPVTLYAKTPFSSKYGVWIGIYYLW